MTATEIVAAARTALRSSYRQLRRLEKVAEKALDAAYEALDESQDDDGNYGADALRARDAAADALEAIETERGRVEDALNAMAPS